MNRIRISLRLAHCCQRFPISSVHTLADEIVEGFFERKVCSGLFGKTLLFWPHSSLSFAKCTNVFTQNVLNTMNSGRHHGREREKRKTG